MDGTVIPQSADITLNSATQQQDNKPTEEVPYNLKKPQESANTIPDGADITPAGHQPSSINPDGQEHSTLSDIITFGKAIMRGVVDNPVMKQSMVGQGIGAGEAGLNMATGTVDMLATGAGAAMHTRESSAPGTFAKYFNQHVGNWTYEPTTETGNNLVTMVTAPLEALAKVGDVSSDWILESAEINANKHLKDFTEGKMRSPQELRDAAARFEREMNQGKFDAQTVRLMFQAVPMVLLPVISKQIREIRQGGKPDAAALVNRGEMQVGRDIRDPDVIKQEAFKPITTQGTPTITIEGIKFPAERTTADNVMPVQDKMPTPNLQEMQQNPKYWAEKKGKKFTEVTMTPDQYLESTAEGFGKWRYQIEGDTNSKLVDKYAEAMKNGDKFPRLILDYSDGFSQEGRHRALAAKKAGFDKVPVAIIESTKEPRHLNVTRVLERSKQPGRGKSNAEVNVEVPSKHQTLAPAFPDMRMGSGHRTQLFPGKFQALKNPIVKGIVDTVDHGRLVADRLSEELLFSPRAEGARGVLKPTMKGALTQWSDLSIAEKAKLARAVSIMDNEGQGFSWGDSTLKTSFGLNDRQIAAHRAIRGLFDSTIEMYNHFGQRYAGMDFKPLEVRDNYFPHMWEGQFRIFARVKGESSPTRVYGAHNRISAQHAKSLMIRRMQEQGIDPEKYDISISKVDSPGSRDVALEEWAKVRKNLEGRGEYPMVDALDKIYGDVMRSGGYKRFTMERKVGARGYLGDPESARSDVHLSQQFEKAIRMHTEGAVRAGVNFMVDNRLRKFYSDPDIQHAYPNSVAYGKNYVANARGAKTGLDQLVEGSIFTKPIEWLLGHNAVDKVIGGISQATLLSKLMFWKAAFLGAQVIQPLQVVPAKLMQLQGLGYRGDVGMSMLKAYKSMVAPDALTREAIIMARHERVVEPKFINQFLSEEFLSSPGSWKKTAWNWVNGKNISGKFEEAARLQTYLSFYHFFKDAGMKHELAMRAAAYEAPKYMVEYHRAEKPLVYTHGLTRGAGQFKTFTMNYFAQAVEHINHGRNTGDWLPASVFMGSNIMTAGLTGTIGVKDADHLLEMLGQKTLSQYILERAPDWLAYGPIQAATGIQTSTLEAPTIDGHTFFSMPGIEYFAGGAQQSMHLIAKWANGTLTNNDVYGWAKTVAPSSMQGLVEEGFETGHFPSWVPPEGGVLVHNPKYGGMGMTIRSNRDWWIRRLAGRPLDEVRIIQALSLSQKMQKDANMNLKTLSDYTAYMLAQNALHNTPIPQLDFVVKKAIKLGDTPQAFWARVRNQQKNMMTQYIERAATFRTKQGRYNYQAISDMHVDMEKEINKRSTLNMGTPTQPGPVVVDSVDNK